MSSLWAHDRCTDTKSQTFVGGGGGWKKLEKQLPTRSCIPELQPVPCTAEWLLAFMLFGGKKRKRRKVNLTQTKDRKRKKKEFSTSAFYTLCHSASTLAKSSTINLDPASLSKRLREIWEESKAGRGKLEPQEFWTNTRKIYSENWISRSWIPARLLW